MCKRTASLGKVLDEVFFAAILQKSAQILTSVSPCNILSCRPPAVVCSINPRPGSSPVSFFLKPTTKKKKLHIRTALGLSRAVRTRSNCADDSHDARLPTLVPDTGSELPMFVVLLPLYIHTVRRVKDTLT